MHVLRFGNKLNDEVSRGFIFANLFNSLYLLVKSWRNILVANLATNFQDLVVKVEKFSCIGACIGCNFMPCITESFWVSGDELCSFVSRQSHFWCRSWHSTTTLQVFIDEVIVYGSLFVAHWYAVIGAFRSSLLFQLLDGVPSWILINQLLCCLIVGIQASGVLIPLSLMMLLGWSLQWIL